MTGNTTTVLIGLGLLVLVLPLGLLVLARANSTIERDHPLDVARGTRRASLPGEAAGATETSETAEIPSPRPAAAREHAEDARPAGSGRRETASPG